MAAAEKAEEEEGKGDVIFQRQGSTLRVECSKRDGKFMVGSKTVAGSSTATGSFFCPPNILPSWGPVESNVNRHPMFAKRRGESPPSTPPP